MPVGIGQAAKAPVFGCHPPVASPWAIIGHKGSRLDYPENRIDGLRQAINVDGLKSVMVDCSLLADGTVGLIHDTTVARTTTGTGNVSTFTEATFRALVDDPIEYLSPGWANGHPAMLRDVFAEFGGRVWWFLDTKSGAAASTVALVKAWGMQNRVVMYVWSVADLVIVKNSGLPYYCVDASVGLTLAQCVTYGCCMWANPDETSLAARATAAHAVGMPVMVYPGGYNQSNQKAVSRVRALGADFVICDNAAYMGNTHTKRTRDTFATGQPMIGMNPFPQAGGYVIPDWSWPTGRFGFPVSANTIKSCLMGWSCPLSAVVAGGAQATYSIELTATVDTNGGQPSRSFNVGFCMVDDTAMQDGGADGTYGYFFYLRESGQPILQRLVNGTTGMVVLYTGSANFFGVNPLTSDGSSVRVRITVAPTTITVTCLTNGASFTVTDSTYRGPYWHVGQYGNEPAFSFSNVSIT